SIKIETNKNKKKKEGYFLNVIKHIRKKLNVRQVTLYNGICSRATYSRIENNEKEIDFNTLLQFTERLGITLEEYLEYTSYRSNRENTIMELATSLSKQDKKTQLSVYQKIYDLRMNNPLHLYNYVLLKGMLADNYKLKIPKIDQTDLKEIFHYYKKREGVFNT